MNETAIIPVYEPQECIVGVVEGLQHEGFRKIIVVDDGSGPAYDSIFGKLESLGAEVVSHGSNRGKGAAIKTGISRMQAIYPSSPAFVTVDGDGQHLPVDVARVCRTARASSGRIVVGTRDFTSHGIPLRSRIGNAFSSLFFKMDTGVTCADTQTGLRCIPAVLARRALECPGERYDYEMNFLTDAAKRGTPIEQVPIQTVYHDGNSASHFRPVRDSVLIFRQLLRFAMSSAACSLVDLVLFAIIAASFLLSTGMLVALATITARLCSGALNFLLNRVFSFRAESGGYSGQIMRYIALFLGQMTASMLLVTLLATTGIPLLAAKIVVDGGLFFASYFIQRNWVFKESAAQGRRRKQEVRIL